MEELLARLDTVEEFIQSQKMDLLSYRNWLRVRELEKLVKNAHKLVSKISTEAIECRRFGRETTKYGELTDQLEYTVHVAEEYSILAALMKV